MKYRPPKTKKKNHRAKYVAAGATAAILLAAVLIYIFFFSGSSAPESSAPVAAITPAQKVIQPGRVVTEAESDALIVAQYTTASGKAVPKPKAASEEEESPIPKARPKPDFPADLSQWTADDFKKARQKNNPRLLQAVRQLGRGNKINADAQENAHLLGELLQPLTPPDADGANLATNNSGDGDSEGATSTLPGLGPLIVEALGVNGTTTAREVLKQILLGKQPSDAADHAMVVATLRALVSHPDLESEHILLAVLAVPDSIRSAGRGQVTADQLQEECLRQIRPIATADFRLHLAQRMNRGVSSPTAKQRLIKLLTSTDAKNLAAQVELLVGGQIEPEAQTAIDRQLSQVDQQVLERLLRATPAEWNSLGETSAKIVSAAEIQGEEEAHPVSELTFPEVAQIAQQLWRSALAANLAARLDAADDLQADAELATCAASVPNDAVRAALARNWQKNWREEGELPENSALFSSGARDPGLLVVLKQLPRESAADTKQRLTVKKPPKSAETPAVPHVSREQLAKQAWLRNSEAFLRALIDQLTKSTPNRSHVIGIVSTQTLRTSSTSADEFGEASDAAHVANRPASASHASQSDEPPTKQELALHEGARVRAAYHLDWPEEFQGHLPASDISPLAVTCLRLESEESDLNTVAGFYERQLKSALLRTTDNGRWVDALEKLDNGRVRSVDVLITRIAAGPVPAHSAPEKLKVDILSVEVSDPQQSSTAATIPVGNDNGESNK